MLETETNSHVRNATAVGLCGYFLQIISVFAHLSFIKEGLWSNLFITVSPASCPMVD